MRQPYEIFNLIKSTTYTDTGNSLSWAVKTDDDEKVIYLLFQQSDGKIDWINNFNFFKKTYNLRDQLVVARGWGNAWKSANDTVMDALIEAHTTNPDYTVFICGWSYGGAIAPLACEDFWYRTGGDNGGVKSVFVTFGAPKSLYGEETRKYVTKSIIASYQFTNYNDCVTLLPPFKNYCRVSTIYVGDSRNIIKLLNPWNYHTAYGNKDLYINFVWPY